MDWQLVQHYRPNILVVGFRKFSQLVSVVSPEFTTQAHIEVLDFVLEKDVTIEDILQYQHADVIVSAGSNSAYLKQRIELPVLALEVSDRDVLKAVTTAAALDNPVMLISSGDHADTLAVLQPLLGARVVQSRYATPDEARRLVYLAAKQDYRMIIGSSYVCSLAEQENIRSLLLYSRESCRRLLQQAIVAGIAHWRSQIAEKAERAGQLCNGLAVLVANAAGEMIACNHSRLAWLGLTDAGAIRRASTDILNSLGQAEVPESAHPLLIDGRHYRVKRQPLTPEQPADGYVYVLQQAPQSVDLGNAGNTTPRANSRQLRYGSRAMAHIDALTSSYARTGATVLITGETGTGKELIAREIHRRGPYSAGEFIAINCGAIPDELFESELFGYADGAFTTSLKGGRTGLLAAAQDGVFFLDEISELPLKQQAKILRVIQERTLRPLGSNREINLNLKFVCASNRDLAQLVAEGRFRQDLFYRLNVLTLHIPPLHSRRADILPIARWMLNEQARRYGVEVPVEEVLESLAAPLRRHSWPGNVREMENIMERITAALVGDGAASLPQRLPQLAPELYRYESASPQLGPTAAEPAPLRKAEMTLILEALDRFGGNRARTAAYLGISTTTLWRRLRSSRG